MRRDLVSLPLRHGHRSGPASVAGQKLIDRPSTAIAASPRISESVGWACVASPISHGVASSRDARLASAMRSVACGPMMWTPSGSSVSASAMTLTKPS